MKFEILFWIIIGVLFLIGLICMMIILKKQGEAPKTIKFGKFLLTTIFVLFIWKSSTPDRSNYHLSIESEKWEEYKVPQIDTMMYLYRWSNKTQKYLSWSTDSIRHRTKTIEYDLFDVYKIKDLFENKKENLDFVMVYIKPNIIRNEKRMNVLQSRNGHLRETIDTLDIAQTDSILAKWGFEDDLFKANKDYYR